MLVCVCVLLALSQKKSLLSFLSFLLSSDTLVLLFSLSLSVVTGTSSSSSSSGRLLGPPPPPPPPPLHARRNRQAKEKKSTLAACRHCLRLLLSSSLFLSFSLPCSSPLVVDFGLRSISRHLHSGDLAGPSLFFSGVSSSSSSSGTRSRQKLRDTKRRQQQQQQPVTKQSATEIDCNCN